MVKHASNDGYTVTKKHYKEFDELINQELIFKNQFYWGFRGVSYKILPNAPILMRQIERDEYLRNDIINANIVEDKSEDYLEELDDEFYEY